MLVLMLIVYSICFKTLFGASGGGSISTNLIIPIPFTNKSIEIPNDILSSRIRNTFIYTFIQLFWWYIIGRFIVKDILSYIDKLQSGEIISHTDTNIKADML